MTATASAKVRECESVRGGVLTHSPQGPLWEALREVNDPELPISLVDLGLIYDVRLENGTAEVDLTFTATACPCTDFIKFDIAQRLQQEPGVEDVRINEVWNPPWTKARVTPEGRRKLKEMGVSL